MKFFTSGTSRWGCNENRIPGALKVYFCHVEARLLITWFPRVSIVTVLSRMDKHFSRLATALFTWASTQVGCSWGRERGFVVFIEIYQDRRISTEQNMFKNTFQSGFLSILYSIGSKPLQIWDKKVRKVQRAPCSIWFSNVSCRCFVLHDFVCSFSGKKWTYQKNNW